MDLTGRIGIIFTIRIRIQGLPIQIHIFFNQM